MAANQPPSPPRIQRQFTSVLAFACLLAFAAALTLALFDEVSTQAKLAVVHVAIIFGVLLCVFRVIGKRELSRLSPFEFVTLMLVPEIVSEVVQGSGQLSAALVGLSSLMFLVLLTSILSHRFAIFQKLVEAQPTILVSNGQLMSKHMNDERIAPEELMSEMHKQGLARLSDVKWAILESGGNITFIPRTEVLPHGSNEDTNSE